MRVSRGVALRDGFNAIGTVSLVDASIDGTLFIRDVSIGGLRLTGARCGRLADDQNSWPEIGRLELGAFRYDALAPDTNSTQRLDWVRRQGFVDWSPAPYEELANYYKTRGNRRAARLIQIAKHDDELTHLKTVSKKGSLAYRLWRRPYGWLLGYGYRRERTAVLLLVAITVGAGLIFLYAERDAAMVPNEPAVNDTGDPLPCGEAYPCFNPWVYGADVVLPIIDFGQDDAWRPVETPRGDQWWSGRAGH
jgi:hypothetical protein